MGYQSKRYLTGQREKKSMILTDFSTILYQEVLAKS